MISDFLDFMLESATNLESYECHTSGGRIEYASMSINHRRFKSFRSDNNFLEFPELAFNLCGSAISKVSLENGLFLADFSLLGTSLEGGSRRCFLCEDHVHLETVNIAGATCISGIDPVRNTYLEKPVPQSILMDVVRKNKKLRWIKCDLTSDNVDVMKVERPEVTFVSFHLEI